MNLQKGLTAKRPLTILDGSDWCIFAWIVFIILSIVIGGTLFIDFPITGHTDGIVSMLSLTGMMFGYSWWLKASLPAIKKSVAIPEAFRFFMLRCFIATLVLFLVFLFLRVQYFYVGPLSVV
jgi:hypothetical protein